VLYDQNKVTSFTILPDGSLQPLDAVGTGKNPQSMVVNPCMPVAYVRTKGDESIDTFDIDRLGRLIKRPVFIPAILSDSAKAFEIHPRCQSVYVPRYIKLASLPTSPPPDSSLERFSSDTRGNLSFAAEVEVDPIPVAVVSTLEYVYVAAQGEPKLDIYKVDSGTGQIKTIVGAVPARVNYPYALAVTSNYRQLYIISRQTSAMSMFTINASTGVPTWLGNVPNAGRELSAILVDRNNRVVYVADYAGDVVNGGKVRVYAIASNGTLSLQQEAKAGSHPCAIAMEPTGRFLFAGDCGANQLLSFAVDGPTGVLTQVSATPTSGLPLTLVARTP
jgi:6-phosphogluconolactonase (cycloisomerase 2 family)